jgi:hypothetical protein
MKLTFMLEKETPGAVQYKEVDTEGKRKPIFEATIGTLYVRKSAMPHGIVKALTVEVNLG